MLKKTTINPSRKSKHHTKQSKFEGSDRQIRGMILRILTQQDAPISYNRLCELLQKDIQRVQLMIDSLIDEGFIIKINPQLTKSEPLLSLPV